MSYNQVMYIMNLPAAMCHELSHLRYADHSPQFWAFVERFAPNWRAIRKKMNEFEAI